MLKTQLEAKDRGFADVVYLDAISDTYLEEVSSCNIFTVKGRSIKTPPLVILGFLETICLPTLLYSCEPIIVEAATSSPNITLLEAGDVAQVVSPIKS